MNKIVKEVCEDYSTIEIDGVYYIFRKEIESLMFDYANSSWRSGLITNSSFIYTKEKCIKNRLIDLQTANLIYKTMNKIIITENQLQEVKNDIKKLVDKVL